MCETVSVHVLGCEIASPQLFSRLKLDGRVSCAVLWYHVSLGWLGAKLTWPKSVLGICASVDDCARKEFTGRHTPVLMSRDDLPLPLEKF